MFNLLFNKDSIVSFNAGALRAGGIRKMRIFPRAGQNLPGNFLEKFLPIFIRQKY